MSETPWFSLFLEWLFDSLDIWKFRGENGCQVFCCLLGVGNEDLVPLLLEVGCVLIFLIILVIHLQI